MPLPRKLTNVDDAILVKISRGYVHAGCAEIWRRGKQAGRQDTFIGLTCSSTWMFYLAPCFGVKTLGLAGSAVDKAEKIARGEFGDDNTEVLSGNTASAMHEFRNLITSKGEVENIYGAGNICYVELDDHEYNASNFDGKSHKAMYRWIANRLQFDFYLNNALGWAIQKDNTGYFLRFSSSLNRNPGGAGYQPVFEPRRNPEKGNNREPRDLPRDWAGLFESVIARDLNLTLQLDNSIKMARMVARDELRTTKLSRFITN